MDVLPGFVDMALTPEEKKEDSVPEVMSNYPMPRYPYGLSICFTQEELEKLDLSDEVNVGDHVLLHCIAKVTSVSKNDTDQGSKMRVEMQITAIAAEDNDEEDDVPKKPLGTFYNNMYNNG